MNYLRFSPPQEKLIRSYIPGRYQNKTLIHYLCDRFPFYSQEKWLAHLAAGHLTINGKQKNPDYLLQNSDLLQNRMPARMEPPINPNFSLIFENEDYYVIDKEAPLPIHPAGPYFRHSLSEIWKDLDLPFPFRPAHRLDLATSGILVLAKNKAAARHFSYESQKGNILKIYLAGVLGSPPQDHFENKQSITNSYGEKIHRGEITLKAHTQFKVLQRNENHSLLQARLLTGRSNQIRIHLSQLGFPIVGDYLFLEDQGPFRRIELLAWKLSFCLRNKKWLDLSVPQRKWGTEIQS